MQTNDVNKSKLMLITSMVIFGTIGIFRRQIPLESSTLALARGVIGTLALLVFLQIAGQKLNFASIKRNAMLLLVSGAFIGINWILLFEAYNHTTVAIATLCYYMAPIFVILVSPLVLRERLTGHKLLCVLVALMGMILVSGVLKPDSGHSDFSGVLFGLGAAAFYASVIIMNQKIRNISAYDKTIVQLGAAALVVLPYVLLTDSTDWAAMTPFAVAMVLVVGLVHTGVAYVLYFGSMDKVPAQTVALFGYIDPIVAILLSAFLLSEAMGVYEIIGTLAVLSATIFSEMPERKK